MAKSKWRGHEIECVNKAWIYSDNRELVLKNKNRKCGYCDKPNTKEGHDGCLGVLLNVSNACCGHGIIEEAYIQFSDNTELRGMKAAQFMNQIG